MNNRIETALILAACLATGFGLGKAAYAQQAPQPQCPDYSQQLAQGVAAYGARDAWQTRAMQLDQQVTAMKKEAADAEAKVTADEERIKSLQKQLADAGKAAAPEEPKR